MSVISGETATSSPTSILKSVLGQSSREKAKGLINKVRFETPADRRVMHVLQQVKENEDLVAYESFLSFVSEEKRDEEELLEIITESRHCVLMLNSDFRAYVETLMTLRWQQKGEKLVEEFKEFVVDLVVAHNRHCSMVLSKLMAHLVPREDQLEEWRRGVPSPAMEREVEHSVELIGRILDVIPMSFHMVLRQTEEFFPYIRKHADIVGGYITNLFKLIDERPVFQDDILSSVILKLLEADVKLSRHDIEDAESPESDMEEEEILKMDQTRIETRTEEDQDTMKHPFAETLDVAMTKVLEYLARGMRKSQAEQEKLTRIVMRIFGSHILLTHNSHHVQFLIFYLCHFKTSIADQFLDMLWSIGTNFNTAPAVRVAAIGYLASMLARAKYVHLATLKSFLTDMSLWANSYIQQSVTKSCTLKAHLVFYATCQAIFYIIAFRSRELTSDRKSLDHLSQLQLQTLVTSYLNPLRVCLPAVATTFAGVSRAHQFAYCHTILERNARRKLATVYGTESLMPDECLDTFFPFDPYLLKKSKVFIEPLYLHYKAATEEEEHLSPTNSDKKRRKTEDPEADDVDDFIHDELPKRTKRLKEDLVDRLKD